MTPKKPHIILLVLDTHRAERMSLYGYHKDTTPVLNSLIEGATLFEQAIAPGQWTIPSHASMFTGLYPTVHQTTQSFTPLPENIPTLAEILSQNGYQTVGFCNNPLVGVLDNGLKRGFNQFYNYGATIPDVPHLGAENGLRKLQRIAVDLIKNMTTPIEKQFGRSPLLLKLATMPVFVPIWSRIINFKGNTVQSLKDASDYLRYHYKTFRDQPLFMFINMMETHLPYEPPRSIMDKWVPYLAKDGEAQEFLRTFNRQSYRWIAPMIQPFSDEEKRTLDDVYDAEVAYQDRQLRRIFGYLQRSGHLEDTAVIVVSDHGESLGEHGFMGHGFAIYNELIRVPLMIHFPGLFPEATRVEHPVSTRRIFHTILELAGLQHPSSETAATSLSLSRSAHGKDHELPDEQVVAEAYPPLNFINVMEANSPAAIEQFRVRQTRRAIFADGLKLLTVGEQPDEFFNTRRDPFENHDLLSQPAGYEKQMLQMQRDLESFVAVSEARRNGVTAGSVVDYSNNPELLERLRGLGYIE